MESPIMKRLRSSVLEIQLPVVLVDWREGNRGDTGGYRRRILRTRDAAQLRPQTDRKLRRHPHELELELKTHMTQKPMLRVEVRTITPTHELHPAREYSVPTKYPHGGGAVKGSSADIGNGEAILGKRSPSDNKMPTRGGSSSAHVTAPLE